ncbi:hypothetical protein PABG_01321 [Paracoccidioides brasiliensis Pb03]|nr:hypothetical protein PABG_01321 [Paracoccidioides brasiliensis Pb03]
MSRGYSEAATPCPAGWRRGSKSPFSGSGKNLSDFDKEFGLSDGDTAAIDFTTDFHAPLTRVKPRKAGKAKAFDIHADELGSLGPALEKRVESSRYPRVRPAAKGSSMLSQPAQRFQRPRVSFSVAASPKVDEFTPPQNPPQSHNSPVINERSKMAKEQRLPVAADPLKKLTRRRTIYIPSEDTTVPSVFMGIFSPVKSLKVHEGNKNAIKDSEIGSLESRIARKQPARESFAIAPRRAPLQPSRKPPQEPSIKHDIPGQNGGKENIPPGGLIVYDIKSGKSEGAYFPIFDVPLVEKRKSVPVAEPTKRASSAVNPAARAKLEIKGNPLSANRKVLGNKANVVPNPKLRPREENVLAPKSTVFKTRQTQGPKVSSSPPIPKPRVTRRPAAKLLVPNIPSLTIEEKYPLLSEDISNPAMYEENWLAHQEVAITQLVNGLFDSARGTSGLYDSDTLRHELLEIYQEASFSLLYKRVQASLLYGALGIPKDVLARGNCLKEDIGRKRSFLNLWIETYDLFALRAAAETVIGRKIPVPNRSARPSNSAASPPQSEERQFRRTLESFLETFILRNEDSGTGSAGLDGEDVGTPGWSYRRTLLRSIMMVVLLDKASQISKTTLPRCLFNPSSKYKSSAAVLQALGTMLLPAVGDITRPLNHLDCQVDYKQNPLQEYDYHINNLAIDLRDGILLTRLVELLLYPSASTLLSQQEGSDSATITMPTGEILSLLQGEEDWILSQHLKIPCISRATKLFNVQIALSALLGVQGIGVIVKDIRAEDIVDGYREKTIALLWGLVGKWGLSGLVDWDDVRKEIRRLKKKLESRDDSHTEDGVDDNEETEEDFDAGYERHSFLLKKWASHLAHLKSIRLDNLTTSFADGRIFESIVDEYEGYIVGHEKTLSGSGSLDSRLRYLGCSSQFASLVAPMSSSPLSATSPHFFDRDFTLAALAFLCCRLLSASKKARAAVIIQSAWRRIYTQRQHQKHVLAKGIAAECMAAVQEREKLKWAKRGYYSLVENLPTDKEVSRNGSARVAFAEDIDSENCQQGQ